MRHIAGAIGNALAPPYGPSQATLRPFTSGLPVTAAINRAVLGGAGAALDIASRPFQAAIKGAAATASEISRYTGYGNPEQAERDFDLLGNVAATLLGQSPASGLPKPPKVAESSPAAALRDQGVRLTPGQMAGGIFKAAEDKATSIPITGDAIIAARRRAMEDYNRAAYNQALEPIGQKFKGADVGQDGLAQVRQTLNENYDHVLKDTHLVLSDKYAADLKDLKSSLLQMPEGLTPNQMGEFEQFINNVVAPHFDATGKMTGETFKKVESILTNQAGLFQRSQDQMVRNFGSAIDDLNNVLREQLADQNPGRGPELRAANKAWAVYARLRKAAVQRPTNTTGVFTPTDLLRSVYAGDRSGTKTAFSEGRALMQDFASQGAEVLGGNYPDSGTAGRYLLAGEAGYALRDPELAAKVIGGELLGAIPYTRPGVAVANKIATLPGPRVPSPAALRAGAIAAGTTGMSPADAATQGQP
jgi:hypothetical protein